MATIVVEDGTQVVGANSYISEADLTTYATDRGITITGTNAELIILAMDYIESLGDRFKGIKLTDTQPLIWPRANVVIDTYLLAVNEIPQELIDGLAEVCLAVDKSESPLKDLPRTIASAGAGSLSVSYTSNSPAATIVRTVNAKLSKLFSTGGATMRVDRG